MGRGKVNLHGKHDGKILLQRPENDDYAIIGGHVAAMETSVETLKREFEEELHAKIEVDDLLAIGEIYFPWGKKPCHQICLYYEELRKGAKVYPLELIPYILEPKKETIHFISKQI